MNEYTALLQVQEVDLELMRLENATHHMPQSQKLEACEKAQAHMLKQLRRILGLTKDAKMNVEDNISREKQLRTKIEEVKSASRAHASDYRSLQDDEAKLSDLAKRLEKVLFDRDTLTKEYAKCQKAALNAQELAKKLTEEKDQLTKSLKHDLAGIREHMHELTQRRKEYISYISQEHMDLYERCQKRFLGLAVEELLGNTPSICRIKLQPSLYNQIHMDHGIAQCPYCHRVLVEHKNTERA